MEGVTPTTLTAQYIEDCVAELGDSKDSVGKVVVPVWFTDYEAGALDEIFTQFVNMTDIESPWLNGPVNALEFTLEGSGQLTSNVLIENVSKVSNSSQYVKTLVFPAFTSAESNALANVLSYFPNLKAYDMHNMVFYSDGLSSIDPGVMSSDYQIDTLYSRSGKVGIGSYTNMARSIKYYYLYPDANGKYFIGQSCGSWILYFEMVGDGNAVKTYYFNQNGQNDNLVLKFPVNLSSNIVNEYGATNANISTKGKIWFRSDFVTAPETVFDNDSSGILYFKATSLIEALGKWSSFTCQKIGYLDYTDTIPTFSGYTYQWYSDEDCTTPIATSAFVSGNRYFVKLTAV